MGTGKETTILPTIRSVNVQSFAPDQTQIGLRTRNLSMTFPDGTPTLAGIDLDIAPGEIVSVVGPSGCGKSTLLRIIAGLTLPTAGSYQCDGIDIGYVFQDPTLLPWRTVQKNVELQAELRNYDKSTIQEKSDRAIEMVGLTEHRHKYPHQLSGGMRMRCSLARSLVVDPKIFLFDEPFGALDEFSREKFNDDLLNLFTHQPFTGLFVTHSIHEAVYISNRVLVMSTAPGRIISEHRVPFMYPRTSKIRYTAEFAHICGAISDELKGAHS